MTDSTIGVAEPGSPTKQLQSYQNTVSSQVVQAEGIVQVDLNGVPVPRGSQAEPVRIDPTGTTTQPVTGTLADNSANPTTKIAILPAVAQTSTPVVSTGNVVPLTVDRVTGSLAITTRLSGITGTQVGNVDTINSVGQNVGSFAGVGNIVQSLGYGSQIGELIGAFVGTIVFEVGSAANSQWFSIPARDMSSGKWITSTSGPGLFAFPDVGSLTVRMRMTAYTSGLPSLFFYFGNSAPTGQPWNGPTGIVAPPQAIELGAVDSNSNLQALQVDGLNNLKISAQGTAQTNDETNRRNAERVIMLAEIAALNSLIVSDNGPGSRNYQELR
jgi:hypothetical protein